MIAALEWVLSIATVLGGIAAIIYFIDVRRKKSRWVEKEKEVNSSWWETSALRKQYEAAGYENFSWSNSDLVAMRVAEGKEVIYEIDEGNRIKYKLLNKSRQVLLGQKST